MSKEAARKFHARIKTDQALAKMVVSRGAELSLEDMVRIARDAGFDCTIDEIDAVGMEIASELGDGQLDAVVGGAGPNLADGVAALHGSPGGAQSMKIMPGVQTVASAAYVASPVKGSQS